MVAAEQPGAVLRAPASSIGASRGRHGSVDRGRTPRSTSCVKAASRRSLPASRERSWLGGLSADEQLLCFHHAEHGDSRHPSLRVVDLDGSVVGELSDGARRGLDSHGFATGRRVTSGCSSSTSAQDLQRPLIWSPRTGETREMLDSICPARSTRRGIRTGRPS